MRNQLFIDHLEDRRLLSVTVAPLGNLPAANQTPAIVQPLTPTAAKAKILNVLGTYRGSIYSQRWHKTTRMTVKVTKQLANGSLQGTMTSTSPTGIHMTFTGLITAGRTIKFIFNGSDHGDDFTGRSTGQVSVNGKTMGGQYYTDASGHSDFGTFSFSK